MNSRGFESRLSSNENAGEALELGKNGEVGPADDRTAELSEFDRKGIEHMAELKAYAERTNQPIGQDRYIQELARDSGARGTHSGRFSNMPQPSPENTVLPELPPSTAQKELESGSKVRQTNQGPVIDLEKGADDVWS